MSRISRLEHNSFVIEAVSACHTKADSATSARDHAGGRRYSFRDEWIGRIVSTPRVYRNATVSIGGHAIEAVVLLEPDAAGIVEAIESRAAAGH